MLYSFLSYKNIKKRAIKAGRKGCGQFKNKGPCGGIFIGILIVYIDTEGYTSFFKRL